MKHKRIIVSALASLAITAGTVTAVPSAFAAPVDCVDYKGGIAVKCNVWSNAMGRDIPVVVKPAATPGNNKVIQFFDGIDGRDGWSNRALDYIADDDATLVFPSADSRSFWVDWDSEAPNGKTMKYETFMTEELPDYLESEFNVPNGGRDRTGVAGLSMGAYSAMNLAAKHTDMYKSVMALSGFYNNQTPIGRLVTDGTTFTHGKDNDGIPWDTERSRMDDNPWLNVNDLNMPVYMTASAGIPDGRYDYDAATLLVGAPLETGSFVATGAWDVWAKAHGKTNFHVTYKPVGIHAYDTWMDTAFKEDKLYWKFNRF